MATVQLLLILVLAAVGLASHTHAGSSNAGSTPPSTPRPNIVFVLADDLGYGELGCFGQREIRTPHIDALAAQGMKLTRFYAGSPVCAPSRSVLMTGLHTGHTRVRGNAPRTNRAPQSLRRSDRTLAEVLHDAGYATALMGKWGLGHEGDVSMPTRKGFDTFFGYVDQLHAHNPYPEFLIRDEKRVPLRNRLDPATPPEAAAEGAGWAAEARDFAPDLLASEALRWIEQQHRAAPAKPFFLFWSLITPHANNEGGRVGRGQEVPDLGEYATRSWPAADRAHAATIARLDADVGRLVALLRKLHIDDRTLIVFTSDNGHHQEGGNHPELFDANGPLRGLKRDLYDGGIRVPTVVRWPGRIAPGTQSDRVGWFADLLPTFAELAGTTPGTDLDGRSLVPILEGRADNVPVRDHLYWEFHEGGFSQAVLLDERWKAVRNKRRDAAVEVYDVATDTGEVLNLAASRPVLVQRATQLFNTARTDSTDWPVRDATKSSK